MSGSAGSARRPSRACRTCARSSMPTARPVTALSRSSAVLRLVSLASRPSSASPACASSSGAGSPGGDRLGDVLSLSLAPPSVHNPVRRRSRPEKSPDVPELVSPDNRASSARRACVSSSGAGSSLATVSASLWALQELVSRPRRPNSVCRASASSSKAGSSAAIVSARIQASQGSVSPASKSSSTCRTCARTIRTCLGRLAAGARRLSCATTSRKAASGSTTWPHGWAPWRPRSTERCHRGRPATQLLGPIQVAHQERLAS